MGDAVLVGHFLGLGGSRLMGRRFDAVDVLMPSVLDAEGARTGVDFDGLSFGIRFVFSRITGGPGGGVGRGHMVEAVRHLRGGATGHIRPFTTGDEPHHQLDALAQRSRT